MKLRMKIVKGQGEGKSFVFTKPPVRIGRASDNDLVLNDDGISRRQCEIIVEATGVMLRDLESANGTKVNEIIATETELKVGDSIGMGPVIFEVLELDATAEIRATTGIRKAYDAKAAKRAEPIRGGLTPMDDARDPGTRPASRRLDSTRAVLAKAVKILKPPSRRSALLPRVALLCAVMLVASGAWYFYSHRAVDQSGQVFPIDKTTSAMSFGKGNVDVPTHDRASFSFEANTGRVVIGYAVASVERADQVEIVVNGERVGYAPQTATGWTTGLEIVVPRRLLRQGRNIVTFDNTDIPASAGRSDDRWGIGEVTVTETALPKPDPAKAKQFYDLGKAAFDTRSVAPQNLTRSVAYLEEARLYLAAEESPSPLSEQIEKELKKVNAELHNTYQTLEFEVGKHIRFGETEQARDALRDILRYFPDPNDARHQKAKEQLTELGLGTTP